MSAHSSKSSESDLKSIKTLLKQLVKDFQSLLYRHLEQIKELKMVKEIDENTKSKKSSHASSSRGNESFKEQSLRINEYYQPFPRRARKERQENPKEVRVELPHFYGKENVETYLDWEMKVEQLFLSIE